MEKKIDAVCGMEVEVNGETARSEYNGQAFYFCSQACKSSFDEEPEEYTNQADGATGIF
jgi:P-type Cu+ transporter